MCVRIGFSVLNFLCLSGFFSPEIHKRRKRSKNPSHYTTLYSNEGWVGNVINNVGFDIISLPSNLDVQRENRVSTTLAMITGPLTVLEL